HFCAVAIASRATWLSRPPQASYIGRGERSQALGTPWAGFCQRGGRRMKPHLFCTHLVIAAAILGGASIARADRFVLASGAVIEGTLVNRDESPRSTYQVRTASGALVTLARSQVDEYMRERLTAEQEEYHRVAPQHADTVDGQWQIAEWCRQRGLKE